MYKIMSFLKRRSDLERPAFFDWWLSQHAPLAVKVPGLKRYTISLAATPEDTIFDGVAELWFDDAEALAQGFASEAGKMVRADGAAHTVRVERLHVQEYPFVDTGSTPRFKLVAALKRRTDLDQRGLRHRESEPLGEHSHDQLGDEGLGSLAGAAELDHEETRIRGDDGRQRSAFPKRLQVPGCLMNRERHEPS